VALALGGCAGKDGREDERAGSDAPVRTVDRVTTVEVVAPSAPAKRAAGAGGRQQVVLRVYRGGRPRDVKLTLGTRPKQADTGVQP